MPICFNIFPFQSTPLREGRLLSLSTFILNKLDGGFRESLSREPPVIVEVEGNSQYISECEKSVFCTALVVRISNNQRPLHIYTIVLTECYDPAILITIQEIDAYAVVLRVHNVQQFVL